MFGPGYEEGAQEECLYCHGNTNLTGPCPVCGDPGVAAAGAEKPYQFKPAPPAAVRVPYESLIAGI